ncbi:MAG: MFS transporter [Caldilineaceae bacterium]|nr:MFS transporter [Caldilineaceae bacterium]
MSSRQMRAKAPRGFARFRYILAAFVATRLVVDTAIQLFYSFLQVIALGMGLDVVVLGRLLSLRSAVGLSAPLFGSAADRYGYLRVMRLALVLSAAGSFLLGSGAGFWSVAAGMVLSGVGLTGFMPIVQAYISAQLPFAQRARGIGILEYSWALAGILGLSLMGLLFDHYSWQLPFFVLGGGMLAAWALLGFLPKAPRGADTPLSGESEEAGPAPAAVAGEDGGSVGASEKRAVPSVAVQFSGLALRGVRRAVDLFELGPNRRSASAVIGANCLFLFSQGHVMIAHGVWLQTEYGLTASALGLAALGLGAADLIGAVLVSLITDRVGKKRSFQAGILGSMLAYISLPIVDVGLLPVIAALLLLRFAFEYGLVSAIALISEQAPDRRGKVISLAVAVNLLGLTLTGFTGPWIYTRFGVWGLGPVAAVCTLGAFVLLTVWGRETA